MSEEPKEKERLGIIIGYIELDIVLSELENRRSVSVAVAREIRDSGCVHTGEA